MFGLAAAPEMAMAVPSVGPEPSATYCWVGAYASGQ